MPKITPSNRPGMHAATASASGIDAHPHIQAAAPLASSSADPGPAVAGRRSAATSIAPRVWHSFATRTRARIADTVQRDMLETGTIWRDGAGAPLSIGAAMQSKLNLSALRQELTPLSEVEREFVDRMLREPLYITHATARDARICVEGDAHLLSRRKLVEKGIPFAQAHTGPNDRKRVASDDHVFFALEAGSSPRKPASRFGDRLLRFEFDQPRILDTATLHLDDPGADYYPEPDGRFAAIDQYPDEHVAEAVLQRLDEREPNPRKTFFRGHDMKIGLSLAIVATCRHAQMPAAMVAGLLGQTDLDVLVNGLFRPTVMVPKSFSGRPVHDLAIERRGSLNDLSDGEPGT